jgi:hypothetical protein
MNGQQRRADQGQTINLSEFDWPFWPVVPLYPFGQRRTLCQEVVPNSVWTFDQVQGIFYVVVPIRMTAVKLESGGLLIYAPIAPTRECIRLVRELETIHGEVKYIILPTISGVEHKVFIGPFARHFPKAQVWVAPQQWSFPLNLPLSWLGFPAKRTQILPQDSCQTPLPDQFDYAILGPIQLGLGAFAEVALFDRRSHSLLITDTILSVPEEPPAIVQFDPYPLLFHARDNALEAISDHPANRRKGWQRIALFSFYFRPHALWVEPWGQVFRDALKASDRSRKAYYGLFPFRWKEGWERSFAALWGGGRPFVAPILQTLILNRAPQETLDWADRVARWPFKRILPCHLDSPINAPPAQFRRAFAFLEKHSGENAAQESLLPQEDFELLLKVNQGLSNRALMPLPKEKI